MVYIELKNQTFRIDSDKPTLWTEVVGKCRLDKALAVADEIRFVIWGSKKIDDF